MNLAILFLAALTATNVVGKVESPARITSDSTYYDRKEGIAVFKGHVHVDDSEYQMHAERAYLFMSSTNTLSRIAANGSVAVTNGLRRAYGSKATYNHDTRLITLHGSAKKPAEIIDATPEGDRVLRGKKIRFWINKEQVEVDGADLTTPRSGAEKTIPGLK